jgi:hypothetical protein
MEHTLDFYYRHGIKKENGFYCPNEIGWIYYPIGYKDEDEITIQLIMIQIWM